MTPTEFSARNGNNKCPVCVLSLLLLILSTGSASSQDSLRISTSHDSIKRSSSDSLRLQRLEKYYRSTVQDFVRRGDSLTRSITTDSLFMLKVFSHDELMRFYHEDFADLLWNVAGFYIHDLGSYGKPITASLNGFSSQHVAVLFDGFPLNESDMGWMNLNDVSLENIDRIEIFSGDASARYGNSASAGYINIVPRNFEQPITALKFRSAFSSFSDVGAFFGRNFGPHLQMMVGGSGKKTPGEQDFQGLQGGFYTNLQRTRYQGRTLFGGLRYLVSENWGVDFYTQGNKDKFDAYGRNLYGEANAFDFLTPGGFRHDERTDYRLTVRRQDSVSFDRVAFGYHHIDRQFRNFGKDSFPDYRTREVGFAYNFGRRLGVHNIQAGAEFQKLILDDLSDPRLRFSEFSVFTSDKLGIWRAALQPSFRWTHHSFYGNGFSWDVNIGVPILRRMSLFINGGYSQRTPSLMDEYQNKSSVSAPLLPEKIWQGSSRLQFLDLILLDQLNLSGYGHRIENTWFYDSEGFDTDSVHVKIMRLNSSHTKGLDIEGVKKISIMSFLVRQSFLSGNQSTHEGIPVYRTFLSTWGELLLVNNNLKLFGIVNAMHYGKHDGLSFKDSPQVYFNTPRQAGGGWILNTRVSVTIGDLQIFYEAENFTRSRFTLLDGYDITPQQRRVGIIWKLYN